MPGQNWLSRANRFLSNWAGTPVSSDVESDQRVKLVLPLGHRAARRLHAAGVRAAVRYQPAVRACARVNDALQDQVGRQVVVRDVAGELTFLAGEPSHAGGPPTGGKESQVAEHDAVRTPCHCVESTSMYQK